MDRPINRPIDRKLLWLIPVALLILINACQGDKTANKPANSNATPKVASTPDEFLAARSCYETNCKLCHKSNGEGGPVKLEDGTKLKVPSLREGHALKHPDSDYTKQIMKGGDGMPAFGEKLKPEEVSDLIRFIRHECQGMMMMPQTK